MMSAERGGGWFVSDTGGGTEAADMGRRYRIAIGGILTESNDFCGQPTDIAAFERCVFARGDAVLELDSSSVGGMLKGLREYGADIVPLFFAAAHPGGPVTSEAYSSMRAELLGALEQALPVDGVLLPLHGSAAAEDVDDPEGDIAGAVRSLIGPAAPIVVSLDLHASITVAMMRHCDVLLGCETYPHTDYDKTGERAARMIHQILDGAINPTMVMAKAPMIVGAVNTATAGPGPFGDLMRGAKAFEGQGGVISTSAFLVHPHLDRPEMGSGALVITNDDVEIATEIATDLSADFWRRRADIEPSLFSPEAAVRRGLEAEGGPVILVEAADCVGGGATGDSVATLAALLDAGVREECLVPVVDPGVAAVCHDAGVGAEATVAIGHSVDPQWGDPIEVTGTVDRLSDGRFTYVGGAFEGEATMGPSAVLSIGAIRVLVMTHGTYDWCDEQFRAVGLDPSAAKFIVAKNPMNHVMTYGDIATEIVVIDSPGPTPATVRGLPFRRLDQPVYPFDEDIPDWEPLVLQ